MLGITLDPNFASNKFVYVFYTAASPASHCRVSRLTANGDVMLAGSEQVLLDLPNIGSAVRWHMGGGIHFGADGKLYIARAAWRRVI